ncbi:hypothetical protein L484_001280 [Morus notabilis]|uniref:Uncharacterized protein n=1 Tax=Morus notabilis TaxID=981085 RepID=W9RAC9_9ROSA|nr:hypothetical protein L484_001280 [Morus notabilis]
MTASPNDILFAGKSQKSMKNVAAEWEVSGDNQTWGWVGFILLGKSNAMVQLAGNKWPDGGGIDRESEQRFNFSPHFRAAGGEYGGGALAQAVLGGCAPDPLACAGKRRSAMVWQRGGQREWSVFA